VANKILEYFSSEKFRRDMAKVGPNTPPYGHSTPTSELFRILAEASEKNSNPKPTLKK